MIVNKKKVHLKRKQTKHTEKSKQKPHFAAKKVLFFVDIGCTQEYNDIHKSVAD